MDGMRAGDTVGLGKGDGHGPWAPWAFALSALAHAALLGLLIATAETPAVPVPEAFSVDVVPGSAVETAGPAGEGPQGGGEAAAEPPPVVPAAEPESVPAPEARTAEAVALPDPPSADILPFDVPVSEKADQPVAAPPVPARKPAVKPAAVGRVPSSPAPAPAPAKAAPSQGTTVGGQDGAAASGPSGGTANGSAPADAGGGGADAMRVYLEEVRRRLQARLAVPADARRLRLGGTVLVRFTVRGDGSVPGESMAVLSGPGVAVLERAALETVARTAPFPPPPRPATVEVPVLFAVSVR
ncbi:TonB family protein [Azospirillum argentinense]